MVKRDIPNFIEDAIEHTSPIKEIVKALTSSLDFKEILSIIMEQISILLHPKNWSLLLVDEEKGELYFEIVIGEKADKIKNLRLKIGEGIAGWVALHGKPLLVPNVNDDPRFSPRVDQLTNFKTKSIICVPIKSKGKVLGVIELINHDKSPEPFLEEDLKTLSTMADYAAIALENARYYEMAKRLIFTDDLTGLYNSRFLLQLLDGKQDESLKGADAVAMIFIDLDYFKNINDKYGHLIGSKTLKEFGEFLIENMREGDIGIRYGGDEFVIILPKTDKITAYDVAKELRNKIKKVYFLINEGLNVKLTASLGVASIPEDASNYEELVGEADKAMYQVKNSIRDGVALAKSSWLSDY